jgi:putative Mn2+ efflux pump MntP
MLEVLLLALALSADAFAVSLGLACANKCAPYKPAILFGLFQGLMPLVGLSIARVSEQQIARIDHWIAFILLVSIGAKMIYDSFDEDKAPRRTEVGLLALLALSLTVSVDALAAGFTLTQFSLPPLLSVLIIAVVAGVVSYVGAKLGDTVGEKFGSYAELAGGAALVIIGAKILLENIELG